MSELEWIFLCIIIYYILYSINCWMVILKLNSLKYTELYYSWEKIKTWKYVIQKKKKKY